MPASTPPHPTPTPSLASPRPLPPSARLCLALPRLTALHLFLFLFLQSSTFMGWRESRHRSQRHDETVRVAAPRRPNTCDCGVEEEARREENFSRQEALNGHPGRYSDDCPSDGRTSKCPIPHLGPSLSPHPPPPSPAPLRVSDTALHPPPRPSRSPLLSSSKKRESEPPIRHHTSTRSFFLERR
ncbi:hypothetical protein GUJ93_ZPchr0004g39409 [Zizania palustris]|uniref:Uncharacterized protein n=1 Tax=Zizania palustris TaxID=103762 RepID=A0A8J5S0P1_ZIZPA|nr:hypothetical protein GUJ93_ZPchr0004g39409 [Zizania palustris]